MRRLKLGVALIGIVAGVFLVLMLSPPIPGDSPDDPGVALGGEIERVAVTAVAPRARAVRGEPPVEETLPPSLVALARRFQPTVMMPKADRFWPISVNTAFGATWRGNRACILDAARSVCSVGVDDLVRHDSPESYLDLPAPQTSVTDQLASLAGASKGIETAQIYFYASEKRSYGTRAKNLVSLQYWFFYPFNYQPSLFKPWGRTGLDPVAATLSNLNYHEGDFEHVAVLVDADALRKPVDDVRPHFLWFAHHDETEGTLVPWGDLALGAETHPTVRVAIGSHASYRDDECHLRRRSRTFYLVNDITVCASSAVWILTPRTPLVDLGTLPWRCWRGHFGQKRSAWLYTESGPQVPLRQQRPSACPA
jgi:hypothetical protein